MVGKTRAALALTMAAIAGAWGIPTERVVFKNGSATACIRGRLLGMERPGLDYVLDAKAGQTLRVELLTDVPQVYFNVLPAGEGPALANTSITGEKSWSGPLPADGDYRVRVYLLRSAARQGATATYKLKLSK